MVDYSTEIVIIGAGISGAVLAERYANLGKKVLVLEKRSHIAGNCYDYYNDDGILVSKYGAHFFHTNDKEVWEYVQRFSEWYPYEHRVLAKVDGHLVPIPVNITTVNTLFQLHLSNESEMQKWLDENQVPNAHPRNGKEAALARVGPVLYEKMFKNYTKKQWDKYPEELDASVLNRIPVRSNFDDRYFDDQFQFLPTGGYTQMFEKILRHPNITVQLNTDFFDVRDKVKNFKKLFYTGPIDQFFDFQFSLKEKLEYRSIRFVHETLDMPYFQENSVINYPNEEKFTRIVEYKHITRQKHPKTTIVKEYTTDEGEPYYPVPNPRNQAIYDQYKHAADKLTNIYFVGRLANYKYFNMDQAFRNALDLFTRLEGKNNTSLPTFSSFLMAGFECTYAKAENKKRLDQLADTKHDLYCREDYRLLKEIGITTVREGLSWQQIDRGNGEYDFRRYANMLEIARDEHIQQIWDLNHFDFPDFVDPFSAKFVQTFAEYAKQVAVFLSQYTQKSEQQDKTFYLVPWNEISFFSWMAGDQGIWAPYEIGKGYELKKQLVRATIAAMDGIWQVTDKVRFIQVDPFMYRPAKPPTTEATRQLAREFRKIRFQSWDMLSGHIEPQLDGSPKYLDIIGVNYYPQNQEWIIPQTTMENRLQYTMIPWMSKYRQSLAVMLKEIFARYHRPLLITETGAWGDLRPSFWKRTLREIDDAISQGCPIAGVCAYPIVDRPDWFDGHLVNSGFWDFICDDQACQRIPHEPTLTIIRDYQQKRSRLQS